MSIVLTTSAVGAISSYSEVVAELRDQQDNADYSEAAIDAALRKAEIYVLRRLRVAEMEVSTTLAIVSGVAVLPDGCRQIRAILWNAGGGEYPLANIEPASLQAQYGGASGQPLAYAREGNSLRVAPSTTGTGRIVYYADLTPLSYDYPVNWLLQLAPDLYVAGAQYYLCRRERDMAGAQMALVEADAIIRALNEEAAYKSGGNMVPMGIMQIGSVRA